MSVRLRSLVSSLARGVLPAAVIFALVSGTVLLLARFHVPLTDARAHDYGAFAIGLAGALLLTRIADFLFFDVAYELRRGIAGAGPRAADRQPPDLRRRAGRALSGRSRGESPRPPRDLRDHHRRRRPGAPGDTRQSLFGNRPHVRTDRPGRRHGPRGRRARAGRAALVARHQGAHDGGAHRPDPEHRGEPRTPGGLPTRRTADGARAPRRPRVRHAARPRPRRSRSGAAQPSGTRPASGAPRLAAHLRGLVRVLRAALLARGLRALSRRRLRGARARLVCARAGGSRLRLPGHPSAPVRRRAASPRRPVPRRRHGDRRQRDLRAAFRG